MNRYDKTKIVKIALLVSIMSFALFIGGVVILLSNPVKASMIFGFLIVSLAFGIVAAIFLFIKPNVGFYIYLIGLAIGFIQMYWTFYSDLGGWGDLVGLISLFVWAIIGVISGAVVQLVWYLYKRFLSDRVQK